jgi:hypothetical protein
LLFKRPLYHSEPKTPAHYKNWILHGNHRSTVWGVDPGKTDIFVAVDGSSTNRHRIRKTSNHEYYDLSGFNRASNKRRRWMADNERVRHLINTLPSVKTANFGVLSDAILDRLACFADICAFYDDSQRYKILKFKNYKGRQLALEEMGRRLTFGSSKYGRQPKPFHRHMIDPPTRKRPSFAPLPSIDNYNEDNIHHYIVAFGNGSAPHLRGKLPAPSKRFLRHLKSLSKRNVFVSTVIIDEYLTSQVCAKCHQRTLVNLRERSMPSTTAGSKIHAVLKCSSCSTVWNRDVMAAKNILYIFQYMALHNNERPEPFKRRISTNAEDGTGPRETHVPAG